MKTLAVLLLSALSFGQMPKTKAQKQDCADATKAFNAQPAFKLSLEEYMALSEAMSKACGTKVTQKFYPVSKYVRKIGVLYLGTIDEFDKRCAGGYSREPAVQGECSAAMDNWDSAFEQIEKMVDIELSDSKSIGNRGTWELLKQAKVAKAIYLHGFLLTFMPNPDPGKAIMKAWIPAMSTCRTYAEFAVLGSDVDVGGTYSGDGGCTQLMHEALTPKPSHQPISAELRARCIPFADGSVDKVLTKAMPLPPKECMDALGWMRDTRLDALYNGHPKQ